MKPLLHFKHPLKTCGLPALFMLTAFSLTSCERRDAEGNLITRETENAKEKVAEFAATPTETQRLEADKALAALDKEIAELEVFVQQSSGSEQIKAQEKLDNLKRTRAELQTVYNEGRFDETTRKAKNAIIQFGERVGESLENAAESVGNALERAGDKIKESTE